LDDREVEDDWDGINSNNRDYVEAQPSKGEQASSRNSNQSINRQENDEVCFHLNGFVNCIIIRGTLEPVKNPGWIWYPNSLANMQHGHRKSSSRVLEKI